MYIKSAILSTALALILGAGLSGCNDDATQPSDAVSSSQATSSDPTASSSSSQTVSSGQPTSATSSGTHRTLIIGLDGVTYSAIQAGLANGTLPNFATLQVQLAFSGGMAGTLTQQPNLADPGWATILSGVWANRHQVNGDGTDQAIHGASLFDTVKAGNVGLNGAAVSTSTIAQLLSTQRSSGSLDTLYDCSDNASPDDCVTQQTISLIDSRYTTVVAQFHSAGDVAHAFGLNSPEYANAVKLFDDTLGTLLAETSKNPGDSWQVIVTSAYGLSLSGNVQDLPLLPESTTFIGINQPLNDTHGVGAAVPTSTSGLYSYASLADITPTTLAYLGLLPNGASYALDGGELTGDQAVSYLNLSQAGTKSATLNWSVGSDSAITVLRDGKPLASLPAGSTTYTDDSVLQYLESTLPNGGALHINYAVQLGSGEGLKSTLTQELSYTPLVASVANGLIAYYPFSATMPQALQDHMGNTSLAPSSPALDPSAGTIVPGPFETNSYALMIDENVRTSDFYEGYQLAFNRTGANGDPTDSHFPQFSVGFWFKQPQELCITRGDYPILSNKNYVSGATAGFTIAMYTGGGGASCAFDANLSDGTSASRKDTRPGLPNQQWVYMNVTFDGKNNVYTTYTWTPATGLTTLTTPLSMDMTKLYTGPGSSFNYPSWGLATDPTGTYYQNQSASTNSPIAPNYQSVFADLAFWNRVLTADEVASIARSRLPLSTVTGN